MADNFVPPCFTSCGFSPPRKGGQVGIGQDFSPAPRDGAGMGLEFLDSSCPTSPLPIPAPPRIDKGYNCKFFIS